MQILLKFEKEEFPNLNQMAITLLNEANERIVRIDLGQLDNVREERNYVKFRLMHVQRSFDGTIPGEFRSMYNSLWSQLYRLEHQGNYQNPYLKQIFEHIRTGM